MGSLISFFELTPLTGKEFVIVNGFFVGSWLCERFNFGVELFSNRDIRPREPINAVCWSSDSLDAFGVVSSWTSTSFVS